MCTTQSTLLDAPLTELADSELVSLALSGERAALDILLLRHQDHVRAVALCVTKNHADADDITQETLLKVYQQLNTFDRERGVRFATWLHSIARNTALTYVFRARRRKKIEERELAGREFISENGVDEDIKEDHLTAIEEALRRLPARDREVLRLRYWKGLTFEEIRKTLGCALSTAARRHSVALANASKILARGEYNH